MQSLAHLHMCDNGQGKMDNDSSSNTEPSSLMATKSSKSQSSIHVRELSTSSATSTTGTPTPPESHPQSPRKHSYTHGMTNDPNHNQDQPSRHDLSAPNVNKNQFLLEQQIKLTQLHQLQQLQNHIFQQQMALISGQPTANLPGSTPSEVVGVRDVGATVDTPISGPGAVSGVGNVRSLHDSQQNLEQGLQRQSHDRETQSVPHSFSGLLTPAHSGEIRPVDYNSASPPMINLIGSLNLQHIEPLPNSMIPSSNPSFRTSSASLQPNIPQRYGHKHSSSLSLPLQHNRQSHASFPPSPSPFNQNSTTSPTFHPMSPMHLPGLHPYHRPSNSYHSASRTMPHLSQSQMQAPRHSHPTSSPSTPISVLSDGTEISIYTDRIGGSVHATPHLHSSNSVHTSPSILGSGVSINGPSGGFGHPQQMLDLDQDISPLTSPWLGATISASGVTAVSTSVQLASNTNGGGLMQTMEGSQSHTRRKSVSGNKRTASGSGDEGDAWTRGGTNRNSRKRPVLESRGRATGSVGSNASSTTSGLVGSEMEKGREGKNSGSTSPLMRDSTSPSSELVSSPVGVNSTLARDPPGGDGGGGHSNGGSSRTSANPLVTSTVGPSARRRRGGSRSTSTTNTPLLRSTPSTTNLLSPSSPFLAVGRGNRFGSGGQAQAQELNSPSPVDLSLEVGKGQDGKGGRSMAPPPLPRGGVDVDMNSREQTSPMDDNSNGMLSMGGMGFGSMMSLDEGMNVGMVGMGGLGGMGMGGLDGMSGMDMGSMGGIGGMSMEEMGVDMGMNVNMGGMGGFENGHGDLERGHEELGIMGMGYGRHHDDEGQISSSSSTGRTNPGNAPMRLATHQQHRSQSHLESHSEYLQAQQHLSPAQTPHLRPNSNQPTPQMHQLQLNQSHHQLQDQLGLLPIPANQPNQQQPIMPVATPRSILNLGNLGAGSGGRLGSALSVSPSIGANAASSSDGTGMVTRTKKIPKTSKDAGGSSNGGAATRTRSMTTSVVGLATSISPALKPLKPGTAASGTTLPSPLLSGSISSSSSASKTVGSGVLSTRATAGTTGGGSITATPIISPADALGVIRQPKRTHRDAEQRRRNSQKQVIDELRRLLPPIALPSDSNAMNNGESDMLGLPGTTPFFFQPTATLLPGGLPPRGPPKAGAEGPNKNVSKLQVLLCGNEYIKLLKARVERRDEEIGKLRLEVMRLRAFREEQETGMEDGVVDLEKDLDADERQQMTPGKGAGSAGEVSVQGGGSSMGRGDGGNDAMDEDDDDGDD